MVEGRLEVGVHLNALDLRPHTVCFPPFPVEKLQRMETKDNFRVTGLESQDTSLNGRGICRLRTCWLDPLP